MFSKEADLEKRKTLKVLSQSVLAIITGACLTEVTKPPSDEWSFTETREFALGMIQEQNYPLISEAGHILLNNIYGKPSFTRYSSFFTDDRVKIRKPVNYVKNGYELPAGSAFKPDRSSMALVNIETTTPVISSTQAQMVTNVMFDTIQLDSEFSKQSFLVKEIFISWQLFKPKAYSELSEFMLGKYLGFKIPTETKDKKALQIYSIFEGGYTDPLSGKRIFTAAIGDLWAAYFLLPDFALAKKQDQLTEADLVKLRFFNSSAENFIRRNILIAESGGNYSWIKDKQALYEVWARDAIIVMTSSA